MATRLAIIGAGPKAMAIASKAAVLAELGASVPEIHIIERCSVGANWKGGCGFTNGRLPLGTSPEKDVGFPYRSEGWGKLAPLIDSRMARFSWQSYLIDTEMFSDWVDRGRPAPAHRQWASYLQWVADALSDRIHFHQGEVLSLKTAPGDRWEIGFSTDLGSRALEAEGLVLTGPGKVRLGTGFPVHDNILTVESFWMGYERFRSARARLAIVGSGENAAAIAMALAQMGNDHLFIDIVSPLGMTYSRGESYRENRVYSSHENASWDSLNIAHRREFIQRTDRGVFSVYAQSVLNHADNIDVVPGRLREVKASNDGGLTLCREYDGRALRDHYDFVVLATGPDPLGWLRDLLDASTESMLQNALGSDSLELGAVEQRIDPSLAIQAMTPRLHLPMLSGVAQGPGYANLSCLGRLSDRILRPYVAA